jgi:hypothetical protein
MFRIPLIDMIAHPHLLRITMRSRHDRATPLGEWSRSLHDVGRQGLYDDLAGAGMPHDTPEQRRTLEMMADGLIVLHEMMALGHVEGRYPDLEEIVDMLIGFALGAGRQIFQPAGAEEA